MFIGYQEGKIKFYTEEKPNNLEFYPDVEWIETQEEYVLDGDEYVLKDEAWEEKEAQKERERINMLSLTAADVERAIYKAKGIDFEDVIELTKDNPEIDVKALKIELKANNFYRGNPYINQIGGILGFSSDELDYLFEYKELPEKEEVEEDKQETEEPEEENAELV